MSMCQSVRRLLLVTFGCGGHIILHSVEAGTDLTANGETECPIHQLDICILKVSKISVALHDSHLSNMQININNR